MSIEEPVPAVNPVRAALAAERIRRFPPDPLPSIIPGGGISLLAGASGTGKTALLADLARRFRDHLPIFGREPAELGGQALIVTDRSWLQSTSLWMELAGFPEIPAYSLLDDPKFPKRSLRRKHERILVLQRCLDSLGDLPRNSLVWIDPIALFLGGNLLDYDACLIACAEIREICQERWITIIGTAHTAKLKADPKNRYLRPQDRILGTTAQLAYTDTQMYLAGPEEMDSDHYTFLWNPHHAVMETFELDRNDEGLFFPAKKRVVEAKEAPAPVDLATEPLARQLLSILPSDLGMAFVAIEEALGTTASRATIYRMLNRLVAAGYVRQPGRGQYQKAGVQ